MQYKRTTTKRDGTPLDKETVDGYEQLTTELLQVIQREYPEQITGQDLRNYMAALRGRGLVHRTVCNYYTAVACFLKFCGVDHKNLLPRDERPAPDDGVRRHTRRRR
jgi:site-specific recombinase XerC